MSTPPIQAAASDLELADLLAVGADLEVERRPRLGELVDLEEATDRVLPLEPAFRCHGAHRDGYASRQGDQEPVRCRRRMLRPDAAIDADGDILAGTCR